MRRFADSMFVVGSTFVSLLAVGSAGAQAQQAPRYWAGELPRQSPATAQAEQVLDYYGGQAARATLHQMPRRTPIQPTQTGQMPHHGKPFQTATTAPTVSPYLNLFRDEDEAAQSAPSYYAFVRPQLEQQQTNERQQRELQRLERQMQRGATGPSPAVSSGGSIARFMDTAQFYGGWQR
jgi:hypothetical protein